MAAPVVVVGAGPAGLAVAACLVEAGIEVVVFDAHARVGDSWRFRYDRLHLHTTRALSALPGLALPARGPRYVSRDQYADYLSGYADRFGLDVRSGMRVARIDRDEDQVEPEHAGHERAHGLRRRWRVTAAGEGGCAGEALHCDAVIVATGANEAPVRPTLPGEAQFAGRLLHSRDFRNAGALAHGPALVIGIGNSGAEIALEIAEHGVPVTVSVRSPINVVRRDSFSVPVQRTSIALSHLPPALGDRLGLMLRNLTVRNLQQYGLQLAARSPLADLRVRGRSPLIDIGTIARIREGSIAVRPALRRLTREGADFVDGTRQAFGTVIFATGYRSNVASLFPDVPVDVDELGRPVDEIGRDALVGVYFAGFDTRQPDGMLRGIARQARRLAATVAAKLAAA